MPAGAPLGRKGLLQGSWDLATHQRTWDNLCRLQDAPHYKRADMSDFARVRSEARGLRRSGKPIAGLGAFALRAVYSSARATLCIPGPWVAEGPAEDAVDICAANMRQRRDLKQDGTLRARDAGKSLRRNIGLRFRGFGVFRGFLDSFSNSAIKAVVELHALGEEALSLEQPLRPLL